MLFPDYINFKSKGKPGDPKTPKNAASKPLSTPAADEDRPRTLLLRNKAASYYS